MSNFALTTGSSESDIIDSLNYALSTVAIANQSNVLVSNSGTGIISNNTSGEVIGYLYQYLFVRYAETSDGATGFGLSPVNKNYYGLRNSESYTPSENPADYVWYEATGGFGTTKLLYYSATGGRQINFNINTSNPGGYFVAAQNTIDLDTLTVTNTQATASFVPTYLAVPMTGSPATPVFANINPKVTVVSNNEQVPFVAAQTDSDVSFTGGTWRIGTGTSGGYGNIITSNVTVGTPSLSNTYYAQFPNPTASGVVGYISVPVRYKDSLGTIYQLPSTEIQLAQQTPGLSGYTITSTPSVTVGQLFGGAYPTTTYYANATVSNNFETITKSQPINVNGGGAIVYGTPTGSSSISVSTSPSGVTFTHAAGSVFTPVSVGGSVNITNNTYQFRDEYIIIRYGDSITGANITPNPDGKQFIGIFNSINPTAPGAPSSYTWYDLGSPLSNTNRLYVRNSGNRTMSIALSNENPDSTTHNTLYDPSNTNPIIDLDSRTGFLLTQAYTAGGSNYLTAVTNPDGTLTYLLPNGTSAPGLTNIADIASLNVDAQGRLTGFVATDKLYVGQAAIIAPGSNVTIDFTHINGQLLVFMNGLLLDSSDYVEGAGTVSANVRIPNSYNGATIHCVRFSESDSSGNIIYTPFSRQTVSTIAGQTQYTISSGYTQSSELLFWNGVFLNDADYDYSAGPNTFKILNTYPRQSGDIITVISFRVLNNNTVPFGQAAGTTTAGSVSVPMTGTISPNYTIAAKNGIMLSPSDATATTSAISLSNAAIFTGELLQSTSFAATSETSYVLSGTTPYTSGNIVVTPTISIGAMASLMGTSAVQQEAYRALQAALPQGQIVMSLGKTLNESDGTGFPQIKHPPTLGQMIENNRQEVKRESQAQIDHLSSLVDKLITHITTQKVVEMTPALREVIQETRTGTH